MALLAPVPHEHLVSGAEVCAREGKVAFGSMKWDLFRQLDAIASGEKVPVHLYASAVDIPIRLSRSGPRAPDAAAKTFLGRN